MPYFRTNTVWYVILGIVSVIQVIVSLRYAERRKMTFAFYITIVGITLNYESLILIVFRAYTYYPKIILSRPFDDSLAGNLFSQFAVASTALILAVFNRSIYWKIASAIAYVCVEEWFKAIGIYEHHWYRSWMTFVSLIVFFYGVHALYKLNFKRIPRSLYYTYIFLGTFTLYIITLNWSFILMGLQQYTTAWFGDPITSFYCTAIAYAFTLAISMMAIHFSNLHPFRKTIIFLSMYGVNFIAGHYHIIIFKEGWMLFCSTLTIFWMYVAIRILDQLYRSEHI